MNRRKPSYSLERNIKILVRISLPVIIINIVFSLFSITITRRQNIDYITATIDLYQSTTLTKVVAIEHFISWSAVNEPLIEDIESDYSKRYSSLATLRTRVSDTQYSTGKEFQYFLNLNDQDLFLNCSTLQFSYQDYSTAKTFFLDLIKTDRVNEVNGTWKTLKIGGSYYFYYLIAYYNRTFITLISAEDFLKPLENVNIGTKGFLLMKDSDGKLLANKAQVAEVKKFEDTNLILNHLVFDKSESKLPFTLHIYVDNFGFFEQIILVQIVIIIMAFLVALTLFIFLFYMQNKIIKPIQNFSQNLSNINEGTNLLDLRSSNIIELEQANVQFKNLMHEIKKLKINIYEQELDKKRIQINFLQQQIRPHFFLSCLTTIYSMAQTQQYKEIETMILSTSKYLRYLFRTNRDFVKLEHELNHINDYLSIQSLRYGAAFSYECTEAQDVKEALIPPLVLMTFIENAIKHCVSLETTLKITLTIEKYMSENKDYLRIYLKDTGPGFAADVLESLNVHQLPVSEDGTHIGITNIIQRLSFLYEYDFKLYFSNNPDVGASIELIIPYLLSKEQ